MKHTFEYIKTVSAMDSFLVEDISNCFLECMNDIAHAWYISVTTELGNSTITKFGPYDIDKDELPDQVFFELSKITCAYNEKNIVRYIDNIINAPKALITQITEISEEEFKEKLDRVKELI